MNPLFQQEKRGWLFYLLEGLTRLFDQGRYGRAMPTVPSYYSAACIGGTGDRLPQQAW